MHSIELDRTDRRLLDVLQEHGRASNLELAEAINLSPAQTLRRHRRLEESGIIKRYEARLDGAMLGFGVVAFIHVTMERGHIRDLSKFKGLVTELAQIQECFSVTGDIDYVLKVVARDLEVAVGLPARYADADSGRQRRALQRLPRRNQVHQCDAAGFVDDFFRQLGDAAEASHARTGAVPQFSAATQG
ncbi:hypothetical protein OJJOAM_004766 [Cupriavidus sp. H18C1]